MLIEWQAAIQATIGSAVTASGNFASIVVPATVSISHEQALIALCCPCGGSKRGQSADIATAAAQWADYKERR